MEGNQGETAFCSLQFSVASQTPRVQYGLWDLHMLFTVIAARRGLPRRLGDRETERIRETEEPCYFVFHSPCDLQYFSSFPLEVCLLPYHPDVTYLSTPFKGRCSGRHPSLGRFCLRFSKRQAVSLIREIQKL